MTAATPDPPKCGWANGYPDCRVSGCAFPSERCINVQREQSEFADAVAARLFREHGATLRKLAEDD